MKIQLLKDFIRGKKSENHKHYFLKKDGSYLTHYTPSKGPNKPVKGAPIGLYTWMVPRTIDQITIVVGSDSTNLMTGSGKDGGLLTHLERLIGRKCIWLICMLHTTSKLTPNCKS